MTTTPSLQPRLEFFEWKSGHCRYRETIKDTVYFCLSKQVDNRQGLCKKHRRKLRSKASIYCKFEKCLLEKKKEKNSKYCWGHALCTEIDCTKDKKRKMFCQAHYLENSRHPNSLKLKPLFEQLKEEYEIEEMIANDPILKAIDKQIVEADESNFIGNAPVVENKLFGRAFQERVAMFSAPLPKTTTNDQEQQQTNKKQKT